MQRYHVASTASAVNNSPMGGLSARDSARADSSSLPANYPINSRRQTVLIPYKLKCDKESFNSRLGPSDFFPQTPNCPEETLNREYVPLSGNDGILSEAMGLLDAGLLPNSNSATRAIGYRQTMEYLLQCREQGSMSFVGEFLSFLSDFQKASRNFAKRQLTWFRNEQIYRWIDASKPMVT